MTLQNLIDQIRVQGVLIAWAKWANSGRTDLGAKSAWEMIIRANMGGGIPLPPQPECLLEQADRIVTRMRQRDPDAHAMIKLHFLLSLTYSQIKARHGFSMQKIANELNAGYAFFDGQACRQV